MMIKKTMVRELPEDVYVDNDARNFIAEAVLTAKVWEQNIKGFNFDMESMSIKLMGYKKGSPEYEMEIRNNANSAVKAAVGSTELAVCRALLSLENISGKEALLLAKDYMKFMQILPSLEEHACLDAEFDYERGVFHVSINKIRESLAIEGLLDEESKFYEHDFDAQRRSQTLRGEKKKERTYER